MRLEVSYATNVGRVRDKNEDALLVEGRVISRVSMEAPELLIIEGEGYLLFAVADGMGGMPCGEVASGLVLEYLRNKCPRSEGEVREQLGKAKEHLDRYVLEEGKCYGMGTAVAGLSLFERNVLTFNVGDCRVYRFRRRLERLTRDHTEAYELYESGYIDEEEIRFHPMRNILTSAILGGVSESFDVFVRREELSEGDTYLICSDGLWDELSSLEIESCLRLGIDEAGRCLLSKALRGGSDNVSFILIRALSL